MGASRIASELREGSGGRSAVLYPAYVAGGWPAGPGGIRRRGSHLNIEPGTQLPYRSVLVPVRPVVAITRLRRLLSLIESVRQWLGLGSAGLPSVGTPGLAAGEHCPDGSRKLIGRCGHDHVVGPAFHQLRQPRPMLRAWRSDDGSGPVHEQGSQVGVTALADAQLTHSPASAALARHHTDPGGELAGILEARRRAHARHRGGGGEHTDTRDLGQSHARRDLAQLLAQWTSPDFPDTSDDAKLEIGGVRWQRKEDAVSRPSSSVRQ